jgi:uncharacterized protein (TIGR02246 family)
MKNVTALGRVSGPLFALLLGATVPAPAAEPADPARGAVLGVLDAYAKAYTAKDVRALEALYAPDAGLVCIGTAGTEVARGREKVGELLRKDLAEKVSVRLDRTWDSVSSAGDVAWVAAGYRLTSRGTGGDMDAEARLTAVLQKKDGKWLIRQWHLSVPYAAPLPERGPGIS